MIDSDEVSDLVVRCVAVGNLVGAHAVLEEFGLQLTGDERNELSEMINQAIRNRQGSEETPLKGPEALADRRCL